MNSFEWQSVAPQCREAAQSEVGVLIRSGILIGAGLIAGWAVRGRGAAWQSATYRVTLAGVAASSVLALLPTPSMTAWTHAAASSTPQAAPTATSGAPAILATPSRMSSSAAIPKTSWAASSATGMTPATSGASMASVAASTTRASAANTASAALATFAPNIPWTALSIGAPASDGLCGVLVALGMTGSAALLAWLLICQAHLIRIRRRSTLVRKGPAADIVDELSECLGVDAPEIRASAEVQGPFLTGPRHPAIFLPATYAEDFEPDALRAILTHEMAHLSRRDCTWRLAAHMMRVALWTQPLLWILCRRLEQVSEECCDLAVLEKASAPGPYADCLLRLAEQWAPSHRERALAASVVPIRSSLGRRIRQILNSGRRKPARPVTRPARAALAVGTAALLALTLFCVPVKRGVTALSAGFGGDHATANTSTDTSAFALAISKGWTIEPVQFSKDTPASMQHGGGVSKEDQDLIDRCAEAKSVINVRMAYDRDAKPKPTVEDREKLEKILADHPHFFYAEYLLAAWYYFNDDMIKYSEWLNRSLDDAPAALAGRYQFEDGSPVVGFREYRRYQYPLEQVGKTGEITFPILRTDESGCFYLPFFQSVGQISTSFGPPWSEIEALPKLHGMSLFPTPTTEGAFKIAARVGILPTMTARPMIELEAPFTDPHTEVKDDAFCLNPFDGDCGQPAVAIDGADLHLKWRPVPGATSYRVCLLESQRKAPYNGWLPGGVWPGDDHADDRILTNEFVLPLSGCKPLFDRTRRYGFYIEAFDATGVICRSKFHAFTTSAGMLPMPLTQASLKKIFDDSGVMITQVEKKGKNIVITGKKWGGANVTFFAERELFDVRLRDYREEADTSRGNVDGMRKFTMRLTSL